MGVDWNPYDISNNALRGASAIRRPPGGGVSLNIQTDPRKKVSAGFNTVRAFAYQKAVQFQSYGIELDFQLSDALNFNIAPNYSRFIRLQDQFVENVNYNGTTRSVVSYVNSRTLSFATRLNYYITPDLSLQYYGEPFLFRATYKDYGYVQDALNPHYFDRFHRFNANELQLADGRGYVDENGDGQLDYSFNQPDINYIQFRSNLVVRWEYVPGSELFLVWSQGIVPNAYGELDTPIVQSLFENMFDHQPHNIFLVKVSYRFLN